MKYSKRNLILGVVAVCGLTVSCKMPKDESPPPPMTAIGDTRRLTPDQDSKLDQMLSLAGLERQNFLDTVGGEAELAKFLDSERAVCQQVDFVSNRLDGAIFQNWVVATIQGKTNLSVTGGLSGIPIRLNEIPRNVLELGNPIAAVVVRKSRFEPHVRIAWRYMRESMWGITAGGPGFRFVDETLTIQEWKPGLYVWLEK